MSFNADMLTVIIRIHSEKFLLDLDQCLFSVAYQGYRAVEAIICAQNFSDDDIVAVERLADDYRITGLIITVVNCMLGPGDHRAEMLNVGLGKASGRYVTFLDHDDCVYNGGYAFLINRLKLPRSAPIAVGRVVRSDVSGRGLDFYSFSKEGMYVNESKYSFFLGNIYPIHSVIVDRNRIDGSDIYFDCGVTIYEDYMLYMRIFAKYGWDDLRNDIVVGEYRIHNDGSNTVTYSSSKERESAEEAVDRLRASIYVNLPLKDFCSILRGSNVIARNSAEITMRNYAEELLDSTSWRVTRPFRALCARLGGRAYTEPVLPNRESEADRLVLEILTSSSWALSYPVRIIGRLLNRTAWLKKGEATMPSRSCSYFRWRR